MQKSFNIHRFLEEFRKEYDFLYESHDNVAGYDEAVTAFDDFAIKHSGFVCGFAEFRGDVISSDREAAAFMFAMEAMEN